MDRVRKIGTVAIAQQMAATAKLPKGSLPAGEISEAYACCIAVPYPFAPASTPAEANSVTEFPIKFKVALLGRNTRKQVLHPFSERKLRKVMRPSYF